jgi:hypothetical protein
MAILGSVLVTGALGANTATFPQVNLNIVGMAIVAGGSVVQMNIDPTRLATWCSDGSGTSMAFWAVYFPVPGNALSFTEAATASDVVFYYGDTPLQGAPAGLLPWKGVYGSATALGTTNVTFTFPNGVILNGIRLVATSASGKTSAVLQIGTTYTLTIEIPGGYDTTEYPILPLANIPSGTSLTIPIKLTAAGLGIVVLYYSE